MRLSPNIPYFTQRGWMRFFASYSLFWRTFLLLLLLLFCCIIAWLPTTHMAIVVNAHEEWLESKIAQTVSTIQFVFSEIEPGLQKKFFEIISKKKGTKFVFSENNRIPIHYIEARNNNLTTKIRNSIGENAVLASSVEEENGIWVGIKYPSNNLFFIWAKIDDSGYSNYESSRSWILVSYLISSVAISLIAAAFISRLINSPMKKLSNVASSLRQGAFMASQLNEKEATSEIREVNIRFNRMTETLARMDEDRAIMLAGISHDLRTPLARLRLEAEMSIADSHAREHVISDIAQLDDIIDKFLEYARPGNTSNIKPVNLREVVESCMYAVRGYDDLVVTLDLLEEYMVLADDVELRRVFSNLLENARRYGKSVTTGIARVKIRAKLRENNIIHIQVRDYGAGVPPEILKNLTKPFFRGNDARTEVTGAGLGLSIVNKSIARMAGEFRVFNAKNGGFIANIKLKKAGRENNTFFNPN